MLASSVRSGGVQFHVSPCWLQGLPRSLWLSVRSRQVSRHATGALGMPNRITTRTMNCHKSLVPRIHGQRGYQLRAGLALDLWFWVNGPGRKSPGAPMRVGLVVVDVVVKVTRVPKSQNGVWGLLGTWGTGLLGSRGHSAVRRSEPGASSKWLGV
jgi:hypothetical protein